METAVEDGDTPVVNTSDTSDKTPSDVDAEKPAEKVAFFSYIYIALFYYVLASALTMFTS